MPFAWSVVNVVLVFRLLAASKVKFCAAAAGIVVTVIESMYTMVGFVQPAVAGAALISMPTRRTSVLAIPVAGAEPPAPAEPPPSGCEPTGKLSVCQPAALLIGGRFTVVTPKKRYCESCT